MEDEYVEKSSTYVHTCPLCGSVRTGTSSLWQHLTTAHGKKLTDVGRWIHCSTCNTNFNHDSTWRLHLTKSETCTHSSMSIRWREKKREEEGSEEELDESALIGLDGRSKPMKDLKKSRRGTEDETEEEREKRKKVLMRPYMKVRDGYVIVHQTANFRCAVCGEADLPTLSSLAYHQRKEHSMQLSQVEQWIRCSGCGQEASSLSWVRRHLQEVAAAAAAVGEQPSCSWQATALVWQVEESSEEARRFREGLDPVSSSTVHPESSASPGARSASIDADEGGSTIPSSSSRKRKHQQRVDKSYILPRPGHTIVRRQSNIVCQTCGEGGFVTCSSIDHHMRKAHRAGVHQAGMWMHCTRCAQDFCNISSVRTHVANEGDGQSCGWPSIFMCWHERVGEGSTRDVTVEATTDQPGSSSQGTLAGSLQEFAPPPKRYRKVFKIPSQATEGFTIVKRTEDLPCFGCATRYPQLTTFIWCMQGKHRLYFADVGAWMECACGRSFTSTTGLRVHLREEAAKGEDDSPCTMPNVALCWEQRIGGRETETPRYAGVLSAPPEARSKPGGNVKQEAGGSGEPVMRDGDIYDPELGWINPMDSGVVKEEIFEVKEEMNEDDLSGGGDGCLHLQQPLLAGDALPHTSAFNTAQYLSGPLSNVVVKEEQVEEEEEEEESMYQARNEVMRLDENEEEKDEEEQREEMGGRRLAAFDPTGYSDGDRFVLRKTREMRCRSCGEISATPSDLAVHLWSTHETEMRGSRSDWHDQQWLECAACRSLFHAATDHEEHLGARRPCSMTDARLCWMEKERRPDASSNS